MLVDAETIPGIQRRFPVKNAEDQVNERLGWNVLRTGILPFPVWRDNRKGVIASALHMVNEVYSPMKLPVVRNGKTSDMCGIGICLGKMLSEDNNISHYMTE